MDGCVRATGSLSEAVDVRVAACLDWTLHYLNIGAVRTVVEVEKGCRGWAKGPVRDRALGFD